MRKHNAYGTNLKIGNVFTPYLLLAPSILLVFIVLIIPIFYAVFLSGTNAQLLNLNRLRWIGLTNYITFFTSPAFGRVIFATFVYVVLGVTFTYFVGLGIALLLNMPLKKTMVQAVFRVILILPWVIPQVVLVLIWRWMLNPQYGVINFFIIRLGLSSAPISWFTDVRFALIAILLVTIWKQYPLSCLILFAGMKTIDTSLYEAASIDGANAWVRFKSITMPGLRYVTAVLVLLLTVWSFTNFVIIWLMTGGGPVDRTATLSIFTYLNAFRFNRLGYGAAIGVVCLIISFIFSMLYYRKVISRDG